MENIKNKTKKSKIDQSVRAIFSLYWNYKAQYLSIDILRIISAVLGAFLPYFIAKIANSKGDVHDLIFYSTSMFSVMVIHGILWAGADFVYARKIKKSFYKFREILFNAAWKRDYVEFISQPSGKSAASITRIQSDMDALYFAYNWNFITLISSIPVLVGLLYSTIIENSIAYLVFFVVIFVVLRIQIVGMKKAQSKFADINTSVDGNLFDSFSNFVNVISFGARRKEVNSFRKVNNELAIADVKARTVYTAFWASASFMLRFVLWACILTFNLILLNNKSITFAQFILSIAVLVEFTDLFWRLVESFGTFTEHFASYKTNYNFLFEDRNVIKEYFEDSRKHEIKEYKVPTFDLAISFDDLNFAYPDRPEKLVLKNLNLVIKKGEKIGVVGKTGSGKSTLVKLLLGFYDFDHIALSVDNNQVSKEELALLNCYVPQDTTLFQQSIEFNIAYAKNVEVSHADVVEAAKKAHAHEFIVSLKDGYDTLVGERGIKLSLGQRQRIALARAFLKDSQLLILDEATSALDSKTESLVQESLEELWKNRTVVAVAHRLSTLNNVDRIIVIDNGEIVEQGSKTELLAMNGMFSELWNHQANGMIIEDDENEVELVQQY